MVTRIGKKMRPAPSGLPLPGAPQCGSYFDRRPLCP